MNDNGLLDGISWPVIFFSSPRSFYRRLDSPLSLSFLQYSVVKEFELGKVDSCFLIDLAGEQYDLSHPQFIKPFSFLDRIVGLIAIIQRPVRWQCKKVGPVPLEELKALIRKDWEDYPTVAQGYDLDYFEEMLDKATTHKEVIAIFGPDPDEAGEAAITD